MPFLANASVLALNIIKSVEGSSHLFVPKMILLLVLLHLPVEVAMMEDLDLSDLRTSSNNYYSPGDYIIAGVIPVRTALYPKHAFRSDPVGDFLP